VADFHERKNVLRAPIPVFLGMTREEEVTISPPPGVPDFRADELTLAEYEETIKGVISRSLESALASVRDTHTAKKALLQSELESARSRAHDASLSAMNLAMRFAAVVKRKKGRGRGLARPTFFENVRTLGRAGMLYRAALRAERANTTAFSRVREAQADLERHERRLELQIVARELELRRFYGSEEGKASLEREPYLRQIVKRVEAIRLERERYQARLDAGQVSADEQRSREMARDNYVFLDGDVSGAFFLGHVAYQTYRYHIIRDRAGRDWLIDEDERYKTIERILFDVRRMGNGSYVVRKSNGPDRRQVGGELAIFPDRRRRRTSVDPLLAAALVEFAQSFY
jgi:hypothetical protein